VTTSMWVLAVLGILGWSAILLVVIACGRAAARPWPRRVRKFAKPRGYIPRPRQLGPEINNPRPPKGGGGVVLPHQRKRR